ncbi:MAG: hypothetical protein MK104_07695 [Erythrobacter sp.]|jgi:hypothetical protein|uniref:hypothetical protein n=1 Tax=Qipengyuania pacifica TaxID=2860199 RepID=UPI0035C86A39|nr:hypothetical protein [Erythrobacter sp.]
MTNIISLMAANENGVSINSGDLEVAVRVPLSAFEQSWRFLDELDMQEYYLRNSTNYRGVKDEQEFRVLIALMWHLFGRAFIEHGGYEELLEMAYYGGPFGPDESPLAKKLDKVAAARAQKLRKKAA